MEQEIHDKKIKKRKNFTSTDQKIYKFISVTKVFISEFKFDF